jgi:hypothetical protein
VRRSWVIDDGNDDDLHHISMSLDFQSIIVPEAQLIDHDPYLGRKSEEVEGPFFCFATLASDFTEKVQYFDRSRLPLSTYGAFVKR